MEPCSLLSLQIPRIPLTWGNTNLYQGSLVEEMSASVWGWQWENTGLQLRNVGLWGPLLRDLRSSAFAQWQPQEPLLASQTSETLQKQCGTVAANWCWDTHAPCLKRLFLILCTKDTRECYKGEWRGDALHRGYPGQSISSRNSCGPWKTWTGVTESPGGHRSSVYVCVSVCLCMSVYVSWKMSGDQIGLASKFDMSCGSKMKWKPL